MRNMNVALCEWLANGWRMVGQGLANLISSVGQFHGTSNGAWSIHGPWSMFCPWSKTRMQPILEQPLLEQPNLEKPSLDHESTMHHWMGHGRWTIHDDKLPFSLHVVASSSWTMDRTWAMDHEPTMHHGMGHGPHTTKTSRSATHIVTSSSWTMDRTCTMDHESTKPL